MYAARGVRGGTSVAVRSLAMTATVRTMQALKQHRAEVHGVVVPFQPLAASVLSIDTHEELQRLRAEVAALRAECETLRRAARRLDA